MVDLAERLNKLRGSCNYAAAKPSTLPKTTVATFAHELDVEWMIERALSFHGNLLPAKVWNTPCYYTFDLRTSAGMWDRRRGIRLHGGLRQADQQHLLETFLHELAHAMDYYVNGKSSHGLNWIEMMHHLGQKPKRTHNIAECKSAASEFDGTFSL